MENYQQHRRRHRKEEIVTAAVVVVVVIGEDANTRFYERKCFSNLLAGTVTPGGTDTKTTSQALDCSTTHHFQS